MDPHANDPNWYAVQPSDLEGHRDDMVLITHYLSTNGLPTHGNGVQRLTAVIAQMIREDIRAGRRPELV